MGTHPFHLAGEANQEGKGWQEPESKELLAAETFYWGGNGCCKVGQKVVGFYCHRAQEGPRGSREQDAGGPRRKI